MSPSQLYCVLIIEKILALQAVPTDIGNTSEFSPLDVINIKLEKQSNYYKKFLDDYIIFNYFY